MRFARPALLWISIAATFVFIGSMLERHGMWDMAGTQYIKTTESLLLNTEGESKYYHLLPVGTALYKDMSFPEGHTRYIAYINIKGTFAHEALTSEKVNLVEPLWAYTIKADEVKALMDETPVSKDELVRILKARNVTREELEQILREWDGGVGR